MKKVLITGSAGFIGFHLAMTLLKQGFNVIGIDNLNDYYDPRLKKDRLEDLEEFVIKESLEGYYEFLELDISNSIALSKLFERNAFNVVIHLAAQAGVRYSIENPQAYIDSNLVGFANILESCRHSKIDHLLFASSSSVYGMNIKQPFSTSDITDYPISLYAATKKSNELLAHSYSHLFDIPCTGLRFFTVYGPYGRPDMAYFKFTKAIIAGEAIDVFNKGELKRDFTYIDDVTEAISLLIDNIPKEQVNEITNSPAKFKIFNIGNNKPVTLRRFITAIETSLGIKAKERMLPMQAGDVYETYADIDDLTEKFGFTPSTSIEQGISKFVTWYESKY